MTLDPEELRLRIADVKRRRDPMFDAAADAEAELAAAAVGEGDPEARAALEQALADHEDFVERKARRA